MGDVRSVSTKNAKQQAFYVCAPSRSLLMEGKHQGHARVRGNIYNGYRETLREGDYTAAMLVKNWLKQRHEKE